MIKGFELFYKKREQVTVDYSEFSNMTGIELPWAYLVIAKNYEFGDATVIGPEYALAGESMLESFGYVLFNSLGNKQRDFGFNGFFNEQELIADWNNYSCDSDEFTYHEMIRIAYLGTGGGLFIGVGNDNNGKIYAVIWDSGEGFELIADDMFEFVESLYFRPEESFLPENVSLTDLYKNWDEDFWRVRKK